MRRLLTDDEIAAFDERLTMARGAGDYRAVSLIKDQRQDLKRARRRERQDSHEQSLLAEVIAAVVVEERAQNLLEAELADIKRHVLTHGIPDGADLMQWAENAFIAEADYCIDGNAIVPVLQRRNVPLWFAKAIGWASRSSTGPSRVAPGRSCGLKLRSRSTP